MLQEALNEYPVPTLADLSRRLGCTTSTILRMHESDLCNQLLARRRSSIDERRFDLRKSAEATLRETPVPSLRNVCKRLGITVWFMNQYFPDVRRRISEQHRRCSLAETARRRELLSTLRAFSPEKSIAGRCIPQQPELLSAFQRDFPASG